MQKLSGLCILLCACLFVAGIILGEWFQSKTGRTLTYVVHDFGVASLLVHNGDTIKLQQSDGSTGTKIKFLDDPPCKAGENVTTTCEIHTGKKSSGIHSFSCTPNGDFSCPDPQVSPSDSPGGPGTYKFPLSYVVYGLNVISNLFHGSAAIPVTPDESSKITTGTPTGKIGVNVFCDSSTPSRQTGVDPETIITGERSVAFYANNSFTLTNSIDNPNSPPKNCKTIPPLTDGTYEQVCTPPKSQVTFYATYSGCSISRPININPN